VDSVAQIAPTSNQPNNNMQTTLTFSKQPSVSWTWAAGSGVVFHDSSVPDQYGAWNWSYGTAGYNTNTESEYTMQPGVSASNTSGNMMFVVDWNVSFGDWDDVDYASSGDHYDTISVPDF